MWLTFIKNTCGSFMHFSNKHIHIFFTRIEVAPTPWLMCYDVLNSSHEVSGLCAWQFKFWMKEPVTDCNCSNPYTSQTAGCRGKVNHSCKKAEKSLKKGQEKLDRKYCSANKRIINNANLYPVPLYQIGT